MTDQKNVEAELFDARASRRRRKGVYPIAHTSSEALNLNIWDHIFIEWCCKGPTMHQFDDVPSVVLDVGCGSGYWAIKAAREWTNATVFGFDIQNIQPQLGTMDVYEDVARRVHWVHGDVLEGLPFPESYFDFVRIFGLGLAVPEDEWQYVLEEVERVLKPGCPVEVIEENLIFPCGPPPKRGHPSISVDFSALDRRGSRASYPWTPTSSEEQSFPSQQELSLWPLIETPESPESPGPCTPNSSLHTPSPLYPNYPPYDPQDHSKLKTSWDAMLSDRFLTPHIITILPFYLSSTFAEVQSHPAVQVPIPSNSRAPSAKPVMPSRDHLPDFAMQPLTAPGSVGEDTIESEPTSLSTPWAPMSLAKTVQTIKACKEAIYVEYEKLYGENITSIPHVASRTTRSRNLFVRAKHSQRDEFERDFANWENDMADRISMRGFVQSQLSWPEPSGEPPDWRIWRDALPKRTESPSDDVNSCRSVRGFVAWKARTPVKPLR